MIHTSICFDRSSLFLLFHHQPEVKGIRPFHFRVEGISAGAVSPSDLSLIVPVDGEGLGG